METVLTFREIAERFRRAGIDSPAEDARLLVEGILGRDALWLRTHGDYPLPDPDGRLSRAVAAREARQPLQYLLGVWSFWRQEYEVTPDCLIPRADTERLVETAVRLLPENARFLDLCTGSGCIAVSTLCERPDTAATALDLYPATLAVAERNAARNGVARERITLLCGDVLKGDFLPEIGTFDAILCNPPYIPTADLGTLAPELCFEPRAALDGGGDGLCFYRRLLSPDYLGILRPNGFFCLEIGYDQGAALTALSTQIGWPCRIIKDFGGNDRVALITPPEKTA